MRLVLELVFTTQIRNVSLSGSLGKTRTNRSKIVPAQYVQSQIGCVRAQKWDEVYSRLKVFALQLDIENK